MSNVFIDVYLSPIKGTKEPTKNSILYSYVLDTANTTNTNFSVERGGNIYTGRKEGDAGEDRKSTTVTFVLQTEFLEWEGTKYQVTFAPSPTQRDGAKEMLKISKVLGKSPDSIWSDSDDEFSEIITPSNSPQGDADAIAVNVNLGKFKQEAYQYSLAVNVYEQNTTNLVRTVPDDPQIRDRGIPQYVNPNPLVVALGWLLIVAVVVLLAIKFLRRN